MCKLCLAPASHQETPAWAGSCLPSPSHPLGARAGGSPSHPPAGFGEQHLGKPGSISHPPIPKHCRTRLLLFRLLGFPQGIQEDPRALGMGTHGWPWHRGDAQSSITLLMSPPQITCILLSMEPRPPCMGQGPPWDALLLGGNPQQGAGCLCLKAGVGGCWGCAPLGKGPLVTQEERRGDGGGTQTITVNTTLS